jgi:2-polyprenyl-6-methoxyphenol hydroxylase-like FAD-dependent oxidoreductase
LGLAEKFDSAGCLVYYYRVRDGRGKLLREHNLSKFYSEYGMAHTNISRLDLREMLLGSIGEKKIVFGTTVEKISQTSDRVQVAFSSGETKTYDLVVGADGIHSEVRAKVFGNDIEKFDNWRVWYVWVDQSFGERNTITEYIEPGQFIGVFDLKGKTLIIMTAPIKHSVWDDVAGRKDRLKILFKDEVKINAFIDNLKDEDFSPGDFSHIRMKNIVKGNVVLMGDAAHGFEPHAGLGASMAMEDGYVLAGELMKVSDKYTLVEALSHYQDVRKKRVKIARNLTNRMRGWYSVKSKFFRKIINLFIPLFTLSFLVDKYHKLLREEI